MKCSCYRSQARCMGFAHQPKAHPSGSSFRNAETIWAGVIKVHLGLWLSNAANGGLSRYGWAECFRGYQGRVCEWPSPSGWGFPTEWDLL